MAVAAVPDTAAVRGKFPALAEPFAFLENAGGSQVPECVIAAYRSFMTSSYVQTTAGYPASDRATALVEEAHEFTNVLLGGLRVGLTALGASTSALLQTLAHSLSHRLGPGDEVVVSVANHEANAGPWARLERLGVQVRWWGIDPDAGVPTLDGLRAVLTDRTRLVAFPHTSNLLGDVAPVAETCALARDAGARTVVDGVAFASHGLVDVEALGADFYAYSCYKVYGPHMAVLFGRDEAWAEVEGPNHFFVGRDELPRKFELGCLPYESLAAVVALREYLGFLAGTGWMGRATVVAAYARMSELEAPVLARFTDYLLSKPGVRLLGPRQGRVPTWSFLSPRAPADAIARAAHAAGVGIRHGHMYSYRLCESLGIPVEPGVVRASAVHYNTVEEVERLIRAVDPLL